MIEADGRSMAEVPPLTVDVVTLFPEVRQCLRRGEHSRAGRGGGW